MMPEYIQGERCNNGRYWSRHTDNRHELDVQPLSGMETIILEEFHTLRTHRIVREIPVARERYGQTCNLKQIMYLDYFVGKTEMRILAEYVVGTGCLSFFISSGF